MRKVKIFNGSDLAVLQNSINTFLDKSISHNNCGSMVVIQSQSNLSASTSPNITVTIFYEDINK